MAPFLNITKSVLPAGAIWSVAGYSLTLSSLSTLFASQTSLTLFGTGNQWVIHRSWWIISHHGTLPEHHPRSVACRCHLVCRRLFADAQLVVNPLCLTDLVDFVRNRHFF